MTAIGITVHVRGGIAGSESFEPSVVRRYDVSRGGCRDVEWARHSLSSRRRDCVTGRGRGRMRNRNPRVTDHAKRRRLGVSVGIALRPPQPAIIQCHPRYFDRPCT